MCLIAAVFATTSPLAAQVTDGAVQVRGTGLGTNLNIPINKSGVVEAQRDFSTVSVGNPEIADVNVLGPRTVYIFGRQYGATSVTLSDNEGAVIAVVDVDVTQDLSRVRSQLFTLLPGEQVSVRGVADGLIVSGSLSSGAAVETALNVAERYAPGAVTNLMTVRGNNQVMLAVHFVEMQRDAIKRLGMNYEGRIGHGDVTGIVSAVTALIDPLPFGLFGLNYSAHGNSIDVFIDALEQKGVVRTLAEPNLVALSGDTADFLAGGEFPIPVAQQDDEVTIEFKPFGVGLAFTPTIIRRDLINVKLSMEVSDIDPSNSVRVSDLEVPGLTVRRANTTVEMRSGQSFAIAGLLSENFTDEVRQVPGASNLPILGPLLRSAEYQKGQTELVMIVTPRIVAPTTRERLTTPGFISPTERNLFLFGQIEGVGVLNRDLYDNAGITGKAGMAIK
jgi:pilus assembly protein CpaC